MSASRWKLAAFVTAAATLCAATCQQKPAPEVAKPAPKESPRKEVTSDPPPPAPKWDNLSPAARRELQTVLSDEFCYCGCPHSLGECLKSHPTCPHAPRMAQLAASEAEGGASSVEISVTLSRYYLSFREKRHNFRVDNRLCQGSTDAPVTLLEFSDFECPHCNAARPVLEKFAKGRAKELRFCYSPFPLQNHLHAQIAGQAALFARDEGKFWAMHDSLFENQARLSNELIGELVKRIGLSKGRFDQALDAQKYVDELDAFRREGAAAGVDSTPMLYINGRKLTLNLTEKNLIRAVEDEMEWAAHQGWAAD